MPKYPDCWESCGNCGSGEIVIQSLLVKAGDYLRTDDAILVLETGKVALDIPSPYCGHVIEVLIEEGQTIKTGQLLLRLSMGTA